jgi:hypothetical protein
MSRFAFPDLTRAFRDSERFGDATMRVVEVDRLVLPTGRIVACDPMTLLFGREPAYTQGVPPGRYPVLLALLANPALPASSLNYETVACAMVRFKDMPVERWEMALRPGWDPNTLKPGFHFGYSVDSGTGCFVDEWTVARLPREQSGFQEAMRRGMLNPKDYRQAYRTIIPTAFGELFATFLERTEAGNPAKSAVLDSATGANIVCFPSGYGDGGYASYFGLAVDGGAARLVTDFGLLTRPILRELELPVSVREHSVLTHPDLAAAGVEPIHLDWDPATGELVVRPGEEGYPASVRFENRPGQRARLTCTVGSDLHYRLDEPLQPTARVLIEYTLRTEAL